MNNTEEKSFIAKISDRLDQLADSKGRVTCDQCGEVAPFLGMRQFCLQCKAELSKEHSVDQLFLAIEYIYIFIDECDESLGVGKSAVLNALNQYKKKIDDSHRALSADDMVSLKTLLRDLGQIGGNGCGAAIKIPKEGKFTIAMREKNGMTSGDTVDLIIKIMLAMLFIDQSQ